PNAVPDIRLDHVPQIAGGIGRGPLVSVVTARIVVDRGLAPPLLAVPATPADTLVVVLSHGVGDRIDVDVHPERPEDLFCPGRAPVTVRLACTNFIDGCRRGRAAVRAA